jgi:hypothetical protein
MEKKKKKKKKKKVLHSVVFHIETTHITKSNDSRSPLILQPGEYMDPRHWGAKKISAVDCDLTNLKVPMLSQFLAFPSLG